MATSDNVIRAGLTPKLRDVHNLISGLTYTASDPSKHVVEPKPFRERTALYDPPIPEFSVVRTQIGGGKVLEEIHPPLNGPSIFIVTQGSGKVTWGGQDGDASDGLSEGRVFFIGARTGVTFTTTESLEVYRAFVEPSSP